MIVSTHSHSAEADHIAKLQSALRSTLWEFHENAATLKVCIISVPVHVISVRKLGVSLAVRDPSERRMVVETWVEDLVDYFLRLGSANFPHGQDGAKGAASDALLSKESTRVWFENGSCELKSANNFWPVKVPDDAA